MLVQRQVSTVLGGRLRSLREERGWTQVELAQQLGVTGAAIGMWENDRREPGTDMLRRMAALFGVTVDALLNEPERTTTEPPLPANVQAILRASKQLTDVERQSILDFIEFTRVQRRKRGEHVPGDPPIMDPSNPEDGGRKAP